MKLNDKNPDIQFNFAKILDFLVNIKELFFVFKYISPL